MLQVGDRVPHFVVTDLGGRTVHYAAFWQLRPLVLVCLPSDISAEADAYAGRLTARTDDLADVAVVVTRERVADVAAPAVVVADQWGEVAHVAAASRPEGLPDPDALLDWIRFLRIRCPECEGEAR
jgi:peroxiredoxin